MIWLCLHLDPSWLFSWTTCLNREKLVPHGPCRPCGTSTSWDVERREGDMSFGTLVGSSIDHLMGRLICSTPLGCKHPEFSPIAESHHLLSCCACLSSMNRDAAADAGWGDGQSVDNLPRIIPESARWLSTSLRCTWRPRRRSETGCPNYLGGKADEHVYKTRQDPLSC